MRFSARSLLVGLATVVVALFALTGVAAAQDSSDVYVGGTTIVQNPTTLPPKDNPVVEGATVSQGGGSSSGTSLAFTGGDAVLLAGIGLAAVAVGAGFLVLRRRSVRLA